MLAFSRPHKDETVAALVERLTELAGHDSLSPDERAMQAAQEGFVPWNATPLAQRAKRQNGR